MHGGHAAGHAGNTEAPDDQHGNIAGTGGGNRVSLSHQPNRRQQLGKAHDKAGNRGTEFIVDHTEEEADGNAQDRADRKPLSGLFDKQDHAAATCQTAQLGECIAHGAGRYRIGIGGDKIREPRDHGGHAATDHHLERAEADNQHPTLGLLQNLTDAQMYRIIRLALGRGVQSVMSLQQ